MLAAAAAGLQPVFTEAYAIPTEQSARIALRTQQIVAYETDVAKTIDPRGGSMDSRFGRLMFHSRVWQSR